MRALAIAVSASALAVFVAGCGSDGVADGPGSSISSAASSSNPSAASSSAPADLVVVEGITASAYRNRTDIVIGHQFQIQVTNVGAEPFTVTAVALDSAGFAPLPPAVKQSAFRAGTVTDLQTPYGEVVCGPEVDPLPAYAALDVLHTDGTTAQLRVPMGGRSDDVIRMHFEGCAEQTIADEVTVTLEDLVVGELDGLPTVTGTLRVQRGASTESVAVTDMRGSVVLQVRPRSDLPATLAAGEDRLEVPVSFRQATCDPHYIADTKQPVLFPLWLSFDGEEQVYTTIPVTAESSALLIGFLGDVCN